MNFWFNGICATVQKKYETKMDKEIILGCHSERSEESRIHAGFWILRFATLTQNDAL
jgi:hypothetical protein